MAQGMDDVDEVRTSRQLDTVLETVGMDCNPGYVVPPEMRSDEINHHVVFFFGVFRDVRADSPRDRHGALVFLSSRETKRAVFSDTHNITMTDARDLNPKPLFPHRHVSSFKRALAESDRGIFFEKKSAGSDLAVRAALPAGAPRANKKQKTSHEVIPAAADPAAAVAAAMAAAKARGGGVVGGGDAVKRVPGSGSGGARALPFSGRGPGPGGSSLAAASEAEVLDVLARFRARDFLRLLGFPGAPVDDRGGCDWKTHPVSKPGDVALRAKLLTMRLDPELAGAHPLAAEARGAVCETLKLLDDKETKREILTNATRRRVDEMRAKNIGDVRGGYVSATGVHYAAGAAAAAVSDYKADDAGEGPAMNPAARIRAGAAAEHEAAGAPPHGAPLSARFALARAPRAPPALAGRNCHGRRTCARDTMS